jgi:hypothetical protein
VPEAALCAPPLSTSRPASRIFVGQARAPMFGGKSSIREISSGARRGVFLQHVRMSSTVLVEACDHAFGITGTDPRIEERAEHAFPPPVSHAAASQREEGRAPGREIPARGADRRKSGTGSGLDGEGIGVSVVAPFPSAARQISVRHASRGR